MAVSSCRVPFLGLISYCLLISSKLCSYLWPVTPDIFSYCSGAILGYHYTNSNSLQLRMFKINSLQIQLSTSTKNLIPLSGWRSSVHCISSPKHCFYAVCSSNIFLVQNFWYNFEATKKSTAAGSWSFTLCKHMGMIHRALQIYYNITTDLLFVNVEQSRKLTNGPQPLGYRIVMVCESFAMGPHKK